MLLLDLPPEVFQKIVAFHVSDAGIRKAAKTREVSKTFRDYINEEMFARQPASMFASKVPKKILKKNVALFLEYRSKSLYGAPELLPYLINRTVDHIMEVANQKSNGTRSHLVRIIITVMATYCDDVHNLAIAPTQLKTKNHLADAVDVTSLTIAILSKDKILVSRLLKRKVNPWGRTYLFGHLLRVAAEQNDVQSIRRLAKTLSENASGLTKKHQSAVIGEAINAAAQRGHWSVAALLLEWHESNICLYFRKPCEGLIKLAAAAADGVALLRAVSYHYLYQYKQSLLLGLLENSTPKAVLRHCIEDKGVMDWLHVRRSGSDKARSLLDLAVRENNLPLVKAIVRVQAQNPNASLYSTMSAAFRKAVLRNNEAMVRFFLEQGVDPEAPISPDIARTSVRKPTSTCELARPGSKVYFMVRAAIAIKMTTFPGNYRPPQYYVWSKVEQKEVLVPYTFHAPNL
ncbi:hypothetical protein EKO04_011211 [Ascochyta lentis]|uniref:Uncharacterized protein n=1 Tax=Ascochyta lentis TaxID=205686 RepID=A0A8H7MBH3_9PLEO|nr:hypothetical protein EKO04_011211 [Ascochyta lentis]